MLRSDRPPRRGLALLIALALCGVLSVVHRQSLRVRGSDPVTGAVRDFGLVPAQSLSVHFGRWWHDTVTASFEGPPLARRNRALEAQIHTLITQNKELLGAQAENKRLRGLLRFQKKSAVPLLAAEVVAIDPSAQADMLTLSRGSADGVRPRTVALAFNGALIGQVLDVSAHSCSVLLLTDSNSSAGAQIVRRLPALPVSTLPDETQDARAPAPPGDASFAAVSPPATKTVPLKNGPVGICHGARDGRLTLTDMPAVADVRAGDLATTSGLGGVFPKGVSIGTVQSVAVDKTRSIKTAFLKPAADFDHLEEVFLRIKPPRTDVPAASSPAAETPAAGTSANAPPAAGGTTLQEAP